MYSIHIRSMPYNSDYEKPNHQTLSPPCSILIVLVQTIQSIPLSAYNYTRCINTVTPERLAQVWSSGISPRALPSFLRRVVYFFTTVFLVAVSPLIFLVPAA